MDILNKIVSKKIEWVSQKKQKISLSELKSQLELAPALRNFEKSIFNQVQQKKPAVIAEIKKASPSKGILRENFDPITIANSYSQSGATCLSILTDVEFFQGKDAYLQNVRKITELPILRKDFIVDSYQIYESRVLGADAILLIVAILTDVQLEEYCTLAKQLGLSVLVEVHDEIELQRALQLDNSLIGINNRNLHTFETSLQTTIRLAKNIPANYTVITESGIHTRADVEFMLTQNIYGFLIGEAFMKAQDPGKALSQLIQIL